jgi:hypothetical protein
MRWLTIMVGLLLGVVGGRGAALPKEALPARETFEVGLQMAEKQGAERLTALGNEYLAQGGVIEREMQSNAQFRALVLVHDELVRFAKVRAMPPRPIEDPVELRDVQAVFHLRILQVQYSNEFTLVKLAEKYVQELALIRGTLERHGGASALRALDEERDRVIGLTRLRQALDIIKVRPPLSLESLTNNLAEPPEGERVRRILDLCRPANESLQSMIGYTMRVTVYEDLSRLKARKQEGAGVRGRGLDGQILYTPRITLNCQHGEIASGSRMVIEYFSRSIADRARHRESVESVLLPRIDRGEHHTFEAKGIQLFRSEQVSTIARVGVSRSASGSEFYGLILHVVDPDGRVLLQRFAPQSLERDLNVRPPDK